MVTTLPRLKWRQSMNVSYTGIGQSLPERLQAKLDTKLQKLSKRVDRGAAREAHVVISKQRHLLKAEVTMQLYGHPLVGAAADADLFAAISGAIDHLEKQATKESSRWRDKTRRGQVPAMEAAGEPASTPRKKPAVKARKSGSNGSA